MRRFRAPVLFVIGVAAGSFVAETVFRAGESGPWRRVLPVVEASFYHPDPDAGYSHRPGAAGMWVTENRVWQEVSPQGLLDRHYTEQPPPGVTRFAVLGDSVVEALQVPRRETFLRHAERLGAESNLHFEIMNLGLAGANPAIMAARLETVVPRFRPHGVMIFVGIGTLLSQQSGEALAYTGYTQDSEEGTMIRSKAFTERLGYRIRASVLGELFYWLLDHSRLVAAINGRANVGWLIMGPGNSSRAEKIDPDRAVAPERSTCQNLARAEAVLVDGHEGETHARFQAWIRDIGPKLADYRKNALIAISGLGVPCDDMVAQRRALLTAIRRLLAPSAPAAMVLDWDALVFAALPDGVTLADLRGFGSARGRGHLNHLGHRVNGAVLATTLERIQ